MPTCSPSVKTTRWRVARVAHAQASGHVGAGALEERPERPRGAPGAGAVEQLGVERGGHLDVVGPRPPARCDRRLQVVGDRARDGEEHRCGHAEQRPASRRGDVEEQADEALGVDLGVELLADQAARRLAHPSAQRRVVGEPVQRGGEGRRVAHRHEDAGVAVTHDLADRPDVRRHEREADRTCLGQHHRQAVAQRRQAEDVGAVVQLDERRAVGRQPVVGSHTLLVRHLVAGDEVELDVDAGRPERTHRLEEVEAALARQVAADEQHPERTAGWARRARRRTRPSGRSRRQAG